MAFQSVWYDTAIPNELIDMIEKSLGVFDNGFEESQLSGGMLNQRQRNSMNSWIPDEHWVAGWLWYYVCKANDENFRYDINHIDAGSIQYTRYEKGQFYNWHQDAGLAVSHSFNPQSHDQEVRNLDHLNSETELIRKLSVIVQLSDPETYEGGNVQMMKEDGSGIKYYVPRKRGTVIVFDSRAMHRVLKVKSGVRKSLVAWCMGPRWK